MNRKCHVTGTINLINAIRHYLHFYAQVHLMCPVHVECQKFQITIKCFIMNHKLFLHNENLIIDRYSVR